MKLVKKRIILTYAIFLLSITITYMCLKHVCRHKNQLSIHLKRDTTITEMMLNKIGQSPLLFIGGYARSGTTLMRAILDVHPNVSCGPETKIIPTILKYIKDYKSNSDAMKAFREAGFKNETLDSATSLFVYYILENHIRNAKHLCAKDPDVLYYMEYLHKMFPHAKFIYMVRDGRAVAYSMVKRLEKERTFQKFISYFVTWNNYNSFVYEQCLRVGKNYCLIVKYEDLVLKTKETLINVFQQYIY